MNRTDLYVHSETRLRRSIRSEASSFQPMEIFIAAVKFMEAN